MSKLTCVSPIDGSIYAERETLSIEEVSEKIIQARKAQRKWAGLALEKRIALVQKGIACLAENNDSIVTELAQMMGRPTRYGGEIGGVKERSDYMCEIAESGLKDWVIESSEQFVRKISREPLGIVFVIAPWNYPYLTAVNTIVPGLVAGNVVVLKHSTQTCLAGEQFAAAFEQAGLPPGVFQNMFLDHITVEQLIQAGEFNYINFTGSVNGGKSIEKAAAGTFTPTTLELGGKDPGYVMEDADLSQAVATLIDGAMFNSGQCCCGIERIYVAEKHFANFVDRAVELVNGYVLGNPLNPETTLGPMANIRFANEVRQQVKEAVAAGAQPLIDSKKFSMDNGSTPYLMPQILIDVDHTMKVMTEETFGPVVGIMNVKNDEEAIDLMNDSCYGLTASLWSQDEERALKVGSKVETGTVFMNRADYLDPALCWSGCKNTGKGGSLSSLAYLNLTKTKSYHIKKL